MTIAKTDARKQYAGDDVTTAFPFPYRFFADSDLQVYLLVDATGVETLQTLTTHYTVSNNGDETGGTVTMATEPATGETLTILRAVPQTQGTDYAANDAFPAETHEAALDRLTLMVQEQSEINARSIRLPASSTSISELPNEVASMFVGFDASGGVNVFAGSSGVPVTSYMATLLDDETSAEARATLEIKTVYAEDFGALGDGTDDSAQIKAAVDSLPTSGGVIKFGVGTFRSPYTLAAPLTKDNVTFQGAGMPTFNAGYTALTGGTIFQGPLVYQGSNTRFLDLGVDAGSDVCTALFAGVAQEGLITGTPASYQTGNRLRNVAAICQSPTAAVHACLYELQDGGSLENVDTVYGASGIVLKAKNINFDGLRARSHSNYDFLIKADAAGGECDNINGVNLILDTVADPSGMIPGAGANWDANGLFLLSTTGFNVSGVNISNVITKNTKTGIRYNTASGGTIEANITQVKSYNHFFAPVDLDAGSQNSRVSGDFELCDFGVLNDGVNNTIESSTVKDSNHDCFANGGTGTIFDNCVADNPAASFSGFSNSAGDSIVRTPKFLNLGSAAKYSNTSGTQTIEDISELNTLNEATLTYLRRRLISEIEAVSGVGSVVAAWFGSDNANDTTQPDYSLAGLHTATYRNAALDASAPLSPDVLGVGNVMEYDSAHVFDTPDAADLSFGDGATDSPFSVLTLSNPTSATLGSMLAKKDSTTGATNLEWDFLWASGSGLYFSLYDDSTGGSIARRRSGTLAGDVGLWKLYAGTYDGAGIAAGIKVYIDGVEVTNSDVSAGSYTAMEDKSAKVGNYVINAAGASDDAQTQTVGCTLLFNVELSAANVVSINSLLNTYFDL